MAETDDEPPTREELLEALSQLQAQLYVVEHPVRTMDRNPPLIAKLRGMISDLSEALADLETDQNA